MQRATPSRTLVFVPSMVLEARRAVRLIPFSACKLPFGTTKLELVTSGRSVWISLWVSGQYSAAEASTIPCPSAASRSATTNADRMALMAGSLRYSAGCKTGRLARERTDGVARRRRRLSAGRSLLRRSRCPNRRWAAGHWPELALRGGDRDWLATAAAERAGLRGRMR
jgi:hypothetical protein